ncbi:MAG: transcriptional repressor LexA [Leptospirales bacterium]
MNQERKSPDYPFKPGEGHLGESRQKSPRVNKELGKLSLTEKQNRVLNFVTEHIEKLNFPPTVREIASYFGVSGKAAHDHLRAIAKKGYINLFTGSARGIEIIRKGNDSAPENPLLPISSILQDLHMVPLLGSIAAGTPMLAEENVDTRLALPKSFLPQTGEMFALKIKGDSMENAGIFEDDIAVIKQVTDFRSETKTGDIVAALIDGEATLKTFRKKGTKIELHPENENYSVISLSAKENPAIIGKLVGIYRKYRF